MKPNFKPLILLFFLFLNASISAQSTGEIWNCQTISQNSKSLKLGKAPFTTNPKFINIFVHIVRRSNGTGGLTNTQINNSLTTLSSDYQDRNIFFLEIGRIFINDNSFYNGISSESEYNSLINTNRHSNAIDIYFLSPSDSYARASGIPGDALAFGGYYAETSVLSHEIGHCLGLYHTHSGSGCGDNANCKEYIDGSNCSTCGDLVCDTPADPCLSGKVDSNCNYTGGGGYSPDTDNIMSYAPPTCLDDLTGGQMNRLHNIITNSSILQPLSYLLEISGTSTVCTSNSTFTLQNRPPNSTVSWTHSSNLTPVGNNTGTTYTVKANGNGNGWVQANVNGATFRKTFWVGKPNFSLTGDYNLPTGLMGIAEIHYANSPIQGITSRTWSKSGAISSITGGPVIARYRAGSIPGSGTVDLTLTNQCGSTFKYFIVRVTGGWHMNISPNPVNSVATITIKNSSKQTNNDIYEPWTLEVYNQNYMLQKRQNRLKGNTFKINTSSWKEGIYFIKATRKDETISGKLIIKR